MWNDPIIEEVREVRNAHAKKPNYDLQAIAAPFFVAIHTFLQKKSVR